MQRTFQTQPAVILSEIRCTYKSDADIKDLTDSLETAGADETDGDNGLDLSIYGLAYEYVYVKENENNLLTKNLSPENTFMVKDDSIEENELFAVYYYVRKDDSGTRTGALHSNRADAELQV